MTKLSDAEISEIIEMALSDKVSFKAINECFNLTENQVKKLMKKNIRRGSYIAWRDRVFRKSRGNFSRRKQPCHFQKKHLLFDESTETVLF